MTAILINDRLFLSTIFSEDNADPSGSEPENVLDMRVVDMLEDLFVQTEEAPAETCPEAFFTCPSAAQ